MQDSYDYFCRGNLYWLGELDVTLSQLKGNLGKQPWMLEDVTHGQEAASMEAQRKSTLAIMEKLVAT